MLTLDCSTRAKTLQSLAAGFHCTVAQLQTVLLSLNLENIYETDRTIMVDAGEYLYTYVCSHLDMPKVFSSAYGFHGTRTIKGNTFSDGLLTLGQSKKPVMEMMVSLAPSPKIGNRLQAWNFHDSVPDTLFQERTQNTIHWGPYGHLIREVHFFAQELGQHDYVRLPELVEDVCNAYQEEYSQDLTAHYLQVLQPCIVWFLAEIVDEQRALEAALGYAYTSVRGESPDFMSVYGIDFEGISVPRDRIICVEFPKIIHPICNK